MNDNTSNAALTAPQHPNVPADAKSKPIILSYVRPNRGKHRNEPIGVLLASTNDDNKVVISWSLTNIKANDRFDKEKGISMALGRIDTGTNAAIPHLVRKMLPQFIHRSSRYFKVDNRDIIIVSGTGRE